MDNYFKQSQRLLYLENLYKHRSVIFFISFSYALHTRYSSISNSSHPNHRINCSPLVFNKNPIILILSFFYPIIFSTFTRYIIQTLVVDKPAFSLPFVEHIFVSFQFFSLLFYTAPLISLLFRLSCLLRTSPLVQKLSWSPE